MANIFYRKLVRDRIPDIIQEKGSQCEVRILSDEEFKAELRKKVGEEASELTQTMTRGDLIRELADLETVLTELKKIEGIGEKELTAAQNAQFARKGGFDKRLFLEWSSDDGYTSHTN